MTSKDVVKNAWQAARETPKEMFDTFKLHWWWIVPFAIGLTMIYGGLS